MKMALNAMLKQLEADLDKVDKEAVFVTHSLGYESAAYLKEKITEMLPDATIYETVAGCVVSSHCGKGTIGILYMVKED